MEFQGADRPALFQLEYRASIEGVIVLLGKIQESIKSGGIGQQISQWSEHGVIDEVDQVQSEIVVTAQFRADIEQEIQIVRGQSSRIHQ